MTKTKRAPNPSKRPVVRRRHPGGRRRRRRRRAHGCERAAVRVHLRRPQRERCGPCRFGALASSGSGLTCLQGRRELSGVQQNLHARVRLVCAVDNEGVSRIASRCSCTQTAWPAPSSPDEADDDEPNYDDDGGPDDDDTRPTTTSSTTTTTTTRRQRHEQPATSRTRERCPEHWRRTIGAASRECCERMGGPRAIRAMGRRPYRSRDLAHAPMLARGELGPATQRSVRTGLGASARPHGARLAPAVAVLTCGGRKARAGAMALEAMGSAGQSVLTKSARRVLRAYGRRRAPRLDLRGGPNRCTVVRDDQRQGERSAGHHVRISHRTDSTCGSCCSFEQGSRNPSSITCIVCVTSR